MQFQPAKFEELPEQEQDVIAAAVAGGTGTYVKDYIELLGFEDRLRFLHNLAGKIRELHQHDKNIPAVEVSLVTFPGTDPPNSSHILVTLHRTKLKVFDGARLYEERLFFHDPLVPRESHYFDL